MIERQFSLGDQELFAELSGDFNPIHVDPVAARRSLFGQPVVHGIHLLLWALDRWLLRRRSQLELCSLRGDFHGALVIDTTATCRLTKEEEGRVEIEIASKTGGRVASMCAILKPNNIPKAEVVGGGRAGTRSPRILSAEALINAMGAVDLYLDIDLAKRLFPNAMRVLPPLQIAELLATTRLVGMECPGLQSIYSQLDLHFGKEHDQTRLMNYKVTKFDQRYSLLMIEVVGPRSRGSLRAFLRPPPQEQVRFQDIQRVTPGEFDEQHALIVGGSRGLGEVTAKLLAAGGAEVSITYYQGAADAKLIVDEIVCGGGTGSSMPLDVLDFTPKALDLIGNRSPTHLYYFATPAISAAFKGAFSPQLFERFCAYYVTGFLNTVNAIQERGESLHKIFYPSTVFIDEFPMNMSEYVAAKLAGETLCRFLEKTRRDLKILKPRLPRLATDQTRSILPRKSQDALPILLEELRRCRDA